MERELEKERWFLATEISIMEIGNWTICAMMTAITFSGMVMSTEDRSRIIKISSPINMDILRETEDLMSLKKVLLLVNSKMIVQMGKVDLKI